MGLYNCLVMLVNGKCHLFSYILKVAIYLKIILLTQTIIEHKNLLYPFPR